MQKFNNVKLMRYWNGNIRVQKDPFPKYNGPQLQEYIPDMLIHAAKIEQVVHSLIAVGKVKYRTHYNSIIALTCVVLHVIPILAVSTDVTAICIVAYSTSTHSSVQFTFIYIYSMLMSVLKP